MQKFFKSFPDPSFLYYTKNQEDGSDDPFLKENGITQNRPPDSAVDYSSQRKTAPLRRAGSAPMKSIE